VLFFISYPKAKVDSYPGTLWTLLPSSAILFLMKKILREALIKAFIALPVEKEV